MYSDTDRLRIYAADASGLMDADSFEKVYNAVSERRRKKTDRMRYRKGKCLSLGVEYLLMCACEDFGIDYKNSEITENSHGKPEFADKPVYFSLSHSGTRVMCAMSDAPVGCDVEEVKSANTDIAKRFFSGKENSYLNSIDDNEEKEHMFYNIWTLKESFMKCTGLGFDVPLDSFSAVPEKDGVALDHPLADRDFKLFLRDPGDGYRYAWCIEKTKGKGEESNAEIEWKTI